MAKHAFTPHKRYALFTVHGEKCYLCGKPVDLLTMEVDHIIPESLSEQPDRLRGALYALGRPADFALNSYENWMPSCGFCNGKKSDLIFEPSPLIQVQLQLAAGRAPRARELETQSLTRRTVGRALNDLQRFAADGNLDESARAALRALLEEGDALRVPERQGTPLRLAPHITLLRENGLITVARGPYGVGGGPTDPSEAMRCPSCGLQYFNGARCISCGLFDDGD